MKPTPLEVLECHKARINCIAMDPCKKYFATGCLDSIVDLWDLQEMVCIKTFCKLEEEVKDLSFSYDGKFLATTSDDSFFDIYSIDASNKSIT